MAKHEKQAAAHKPVQHGTKVEHHDHQADDKAHTHRKHPEKKTKGATHR